MIPLTLAEVAAATGGRLVGAEPTDVVSAVSTDSRASGPGDLFVAIVGATHDAHDHVPAAIAAGAVAALVSRPVEAPCVVVDDTVVALGRLARAVVDRLPACQVVAITGSSGKTSTKDLVAAVLADAAETIAPPGSFNNEIGLPTTVLRADAATRFLVLEMGMRGSGHIDYLCSVAPPSVAVVTNVGTAHIELLGSQEAIADAKAEVVRALEPGGVAVLNHDDARVLAMRGRTRARSITYGESAGSDVRAVGVRLDALARPSFVVEHGGRSAAVSLRVHGRHQVGNALAAAAVGLAAGLDLDTVAASLGRAEPSSRWRMEVVRTAGGHTIVNDAYNANPESTAAGLEALVAMAAAGRSWAVLGEMREIGAGSAAAHRAVGELAAALGVDRVVAVGEGARPLHEGAREVMGPDRATWVPGSDEAVAEVLAGLEPGDVVLVKASRSIGLERVAVALEEALGREDGDP